MDLLLLTPQFAPHFEGGTEFVARAQARELRALGHRVRVVSGTDSPLGDEPRERHEVDGFEVTFLPRGADESYDLALERPRIAALVEEEARGADLVHVHHWSTLCGDLLRRLAPRLPTVVTLHDLFSTCPRFFRVPTAPVTRCPEPADHEPCARCVVMDAPGLSLADLEQRLGARAEWLRLELAAADRVLLPSHSHHAGILPFFPFLAESARVLPHGLCALPGSDASAAGPWSGTGPLRVLFLGHRTPVKGVGDLVEAVAGLEEARRGRIELLLLGGEVEPGFDRVLRELGPGLRITFGGAYRVEELAQRVAELGGAHLAALPSRVNESYGLVLDEAQALGLPAWVSDRGAPKERVAGAGRVLPAEDPLAWRGALREVLDSPEILERERRALPASVRTAHDAALELEALYTELIEARQ